MSYDAKLREEELKNKVAHDYFNEYDNTKIIGNIDFCISTSVLGEAYSFLWAEAKAGARKDIYESFVQLILTIGKERTFEKFLPPVYLGAFDAEKIAFLPYHIVNDVFSLNDFNWNVTPSNHETKEFNQLYELAKAAIESDILLFKFKENSKELKKFIKSNFITGKTKTSKIEITKNNFTSIYYHWLREVKETINIDWSMAKKKNILSADFFLADILSIENKTLQDKLYVLLNTDKYVFEKNIDEMGLINTKTATFKDGQKAHTQFWNKYKRPPQEQFWDYIIERRDLLVPQDIRERKGSYFTPQCWVELSQKYIADVLGEDWQENYYIWDCAAGTGNLLVGLTEPHRIWASTIDQADVDIMKERCQNGASLLESHIFQFDFLNDDFSKCPESLRKIIEDEEKRKKLVIYINPPYAEHGDKKQISGTGQNKSGVAKETLVYKLYKDRIGTAARELYVQFLIRIFSDFRNCWLVNFSTLKNLQASNFGKFRDAYTAKLEKLFLVPANTFDNVKGQFPIGFFVWNTGETERFTSIIADIYDKDRNLFCKKTIYCYDDKKFVIEWLRGFYDRANHIGYLNIAGTDVQHNSCIFVSNFLSKNAIKEKLYTHITKHNLIEMAIYDTIRHVIDDSWINDRDQYIYPLPTWRNDEYFKTNCITYTLFNNNIQSGHGINHWIPFTEKEINAKDCFDSHFMTDYMAGKKIKDNGTEQGQTSLIQQKSSLPQKPLVFSDAAKAVFDAGRELWKYYHSMPDANPNAALYDIKEYFQGRNEKGRMNSNSGDEKYNELMDTLRGKLKILARKIEPKVYEHGFLLR